MRKKNVDARPATELKRERPVSPVVRVTRKISERVRLLIAVRSGGRCEFDGCNRYLFEHPLTLRSGNFSQSAHIVAFSPRGPRGATAISLRKLNQPSNLMLLCADCHRLIDTRPGEFSVKILRKYKRQHEERIRFVTDLGPDRKTTVVKLTSRIGGQPVSIPMAQIIRAISPLYPTDRKGWIIDLGAIEGEQRAFFDAAADTVRSRIRRLFDPGMDGSETRHISLFALAPIPLLVLAGREIGNKVPLALYQRHRDTESWVWKQGGAPTEYDVRVVRTGKDPLRVALVVSLSGKIRESDLPTEIDEQFTIYEITPAGRNPSPDFLTLREELLGFKAAYLECLTSITRDHPGLDTIHLFPACPAPIAVLCGRELHPKVHPALLVYDNDKRQGGFLPILKVNEP